MAADMDRAGLKSPRQEERERMEDAGERLLLNHKRRQDSWLPEEENSSGARDEA